MSQERDACKRNLKYTCRFSQVVNQGYRGRVVTGPFFMHMNKRKTKRKIPLGTGYVLGLIFGLAIIIPFLISLGPTFFGFLLGLSFSLSIGIAFECAFAEDKHLPLFQKILLSLSAVLLILSVVSLIMWDAL